jgi:hypothetical protein
MSVLQKVFDDWDCESAELLDTDVRGTEYPAIDVRAAASNAVEELGIEDPERGGYAVPLFQIDDPVPTNEYVVYRPETDEVGWYDAGLGVNGTERFVDSERLREKEIGRRLRYWIDEHRNGELGVDTSDFPAERVRPVDELGEDEQEAFFEELKSFVRSEMDAERDRNWEQYRDLGFHEAVRRNRVSGPFLFLSQTRRRGSDAFRYQIEVEDGESVNLRGDEGLFEDNYCILDADTDDDAVPITVELLSVSDTQLTVQPAWNEIDDDDDVKRILTSDDVEIWLHELVNPVPFERRLEAIERVEEDERKRELITGARPIRYSVDKYDLPEPRIELNEFQNLALTWADGADDIVCIHGPPGTGKTRTLTAYVEHAVSEGKSVLVTAHSNQAVDNLIVGDSTVESSEEGTLHAMALDDEIELSIARVGSNSRNEVVAEYYSDRSPKGTDVTAATTSGAARFEQNEFDVAVVDEATQASRPATAIALNCANELVLAGDHEQLPPYCADESQKEEDMHVSLFEYLLERYGERNSVLLRKQYRMNEEIASFPNEEFYGGRLRTAARNSEWTVSDLKPIIGLDIDGDESFSSYSKSYANGDEAEAVAKQVRLAAQEGVPSQDIGVITAYSGQIRKIASKVNNLDIDEPRNVTIDTVDSFQGGERDVIVVSFVRSNDDRRSGFLEFPDEGPRRLNVALTRARKRLVLIGDWETLGTIAPHRSSETSSAPVYSRLEDHLVSMGRMKSS